MAYKQEMYSLQRIDEPRIEILFNFLDGEGAFESETTSEFAVNGYKVLVVPTEEGYQIDKINGLSPDEPKTVFRLIEQETDYRVADVSMWELGWLMPSDKK